MVLMRYKKVVWMPTPTFRSCLDTCALWTTLSVFFFLVGCGTLPVNNQETPEASSSVLFNLYRGPLNHLQAVRRGECPMYPSCSEFARQAIAKHGPLKGWLMATDRLIRCGRDETRLAPRVLVNGRIKYYDPVDSNDFWWAKKTAPIRKLRTAY